MRQITSVDENISLSHLEIVLTVGIGNQSQIHVIRWPMFLTLSSRIAVVQSTSVVELFGDAELTRKSWGY